MKPFKVILIIVMITMFFACSSNSKSKKPVVPQKSPVELAADKALEADAALENQDFQTAIDTYNSAIEMYKQALPSATAADNIPKVIYNLKKNIANIHLKQAQDYTKQEQYNDAVNSYEEGLKVLNEIKADSSPEENLNTTINMLYKNIAIVSEEAGDYEKALQNYDNFMIAYPDSTGYLINKFYIYRDDLKSEAEAYAVLSSYALTNNDFNSSYMLGNLYRDKKDLTNAIWWYEKADSIKTDADVLSNLGNIYRQKSMWDKSTKVLDKLLTLKLQPTEISTAYKLIGDNYKQLKNKAKAVEYFEKYSEIDYNENIALYICVYYNDMKNNVKAISWANKILQNNPVQSDALFIRATAKYNQKDMKGAKADFEKLQNDPKYGKYAQQYLKSM